MGYGYSRPPNVSAPVNVTRVLTTAYQPNVNSPVSVTCTVDLPGGDGDAVDQIVLEISPDGTTGFIIADEAYNNFDVLGLLGVGGQDDDRDNLIGHVPIGYWYRIRRITGTGTIIRTTESTWL